MSATRAQRRQFERHQLFVDRVTAADAAFFARFPSRNHRIRLAAPAEIAQNALTAEAMGDAPTALMPGARHIVLVKQIMPGVRLRVAAQGSIFEDLDLSEDEVRALYESTVLPGTYWYEKERELRARMRAAGLLE